MVAPRFILTTIYGIGAARSFFQWIYSTTGCGRCCDFHQIIDRPKIRQEKASYPSCVGRDVNQSDIYWVQGY